MLAHRFSWLVTFGSLPEKPYVCHRCDNRLCVNPEHLFPGDAKDNNDDMTKKGRANRVGWPRKQGPEQVLKIRQMYGTGLFTFDSLAKRLSITPKMVESALYKWKRVKIYGKNEI